jgi:hypothetical protein
MGINKYLNLRSLNMKILPCNKCPYLDKGYCDLFHIELKTVFDSPISSTYPVRCEQCETKFNKVPQREIDSKLDLELDILTTSSIYYCSKCPYVTRDKNKKIICGNKFSLHFGQYAEWYSGHCHSAEVRRICSNCAFTSNCLHKDFSDNCEDWKHRSVTVNTALFAIDIQMKYFNKYE